MYKLSTVNADVCMYACMHKDVVYVVEIYTFFLVMVCMYDFLMCTCTTIDIMLYINYTET